MGPKDIIPTRTPWSLVAEIRASGFSALVRLDKLPKAVLIAILSASCGHDDHLMVLAANRSTVRDPSEETDGLCCRQLARNGQNVVINSSEMYQTSPRIGIVKKTLNSYLFPTLRVSHAHTFR